MDNVKVKGITDECGVKHFSITNTDTGEIHMAIRSGQMFELGEFRGTLKQCKQLVSDQKVVHFADAKDEEPKESSETWDCVSPAALLAMVVHGGEGNVMELIDGKNSEVERTLDSFGFMKPDGSIDFASAMREFERGARK